MTTRIPLLVALVFLASTLATAIPAVGLLNALAMTAGAAAYGCMAAAITISTRHPMVERVFGPLDKAYGVHKKLGMASIGTLVAHVALTLAARDISPLHAATAGGPVVPLAVMGAVGFLLLLLAAGSALNVRLPYHLFQKVHGPAAGAAFTVLSLHAVVGALAGPVTALAPTLWTLAFALVGLVALAQRVLSRRPRPGQAITRVDDRERAIEVSWPHQAPTSHMPGQFVLLTATVSGRRETHPFTLTSAAGAGHNSVLIRDAGDWTGQAHRALKAGDTLTVEGPFGDFLPGSSTGPELWIAGGAGITPFLSALRTATAQGAGDHPPVHLVFSARSAEDAPAWDEIREMSHSLPWLSLQPAFSSEGERLEGAALELRAANVGGADWYVCGPQGLVQAARGAHARSTGHGSFHAEAYSWR